MPECKSIICPGVSISKCESLPCKPNENQFTSRIASFAWLPDYHYTIPILINELIVRIENNLGRKINYKAFTDSTPLLERDIAQRAGLGWIGKNSA